MGTSTREQKDPAERKRGDQELVVQRPANMRKVLNDQQAYALFGEGLPDSAEIVNGLHAAATGLSLLAARYGAAILTGEMPDRTTKQMTVADRFALEAMPKISMEQKRTGKLPDVGKGPKGDPVRELVEEADSVRMSSGG